MPTGAELRAYYEHKAQTLDELALTYENPNSYKHFFYQARSEAVLRALAPIQAGGWILDVGAGSGYYGQRIAASGANAVLIDLSYTVLEQARSAGTIAVGYICCDAANLPFAGQFFDKLLCTEVLEHLLNQLRTLQECERVLANDGELVVTTPSRWSPMNLAYALKRRIRGYAFNEHLTEFTISEFKAVLSRTFIIQKFEYANFLVPYPFDQFFIHAQSDRSIQLLHSLENTLAHMPILCHLGWTMIATCRKKTKA